MKLVPLNKFPGYFANREGFIIKPENGRDYKMPIFFKQGVKKPFVKIRYTDHELLFLLMDAFSIGALATDKVKYKVKKGGNIPIDTIQIKPFERMKTYGCALKASSANSRCHGMLTEYEVYESLKVTDFKCFYCGINLSHNNWHLDHYIPVSKCGRNLFSNIVPSCPTCNMMKSNLLPDTFTGLCEKISNHSLEMRIKNIKSIA